MKKGSNGKRVTKTTPVTTPQVTPVTVGSTPTQVVELTPVQRVTQLLTQLCDSRWSLTPTQRATLVNRMVGIASDMSGATTPGTAINAFMALVEAEKVDIAAAKLLVDAIRPTLDNGGGNGNGATKPTVEVSYDDVAEGAAKLLEHNRTATVDAGSTGPDGGQGDSDVDGPAVVGTVAFDD